MRKLVPAFLWLLFVVVLVGCDVPTPPPELPTPTPGSGNPENAMSRMALTPFALTPVKPFAPLDAPPGHIYFVRDGHPWRINPDGSGEIQLADFTVNSPPQPSPDGSFVALVSDKDLYVVPSGGGTPQKLATGEMAEDQRLGWTPDGKMVGYVTLDPATAGNEQAWAASIKGGDPVAITTINQAVSGIGPEYQRAVLWSHDGDWVLVAGANNPMRLLHWSLSNQSPGDGRDIPGGEPDWSPDGRWILYAATLSGGLAIYDVLGSEATPFRNELALVGTRLGEYGQGPGAQWSPASNGGDGDVLAYRSRSSSGDPQVALRQRNGVELDPVPSPSNNPSWSPGGGQLVVETGYLKQDTLGLRWVGDGLSTVKLNLQGKQTVTPLTRNAQWPVWGK